MFDVNRQCHKDPQVFGSCPNQLLFGSLAKRKYIYFRKIKPLDGIFTYFIWSQKNVVLEEIKIRSECDHISLVSDKLSADFVRMFFPPLPLQRSLLLFAFRSSFTIIP
ncbi:unnamed protein product [Angiostrongylus costaricensis]|uniref:Ovule protein n=1 Tax=Angiostrongylus costaricensis TaxID=334426 RepID=A0A0R3PYZ7_ANGCS|nr:unnamed protein product [Angiostrongylus costaricensis]